MKALKRNYDKWGIITSLACAIHCAVLPVFAAALPFLGINFIENSFIDYSLIGFSFFFGVFSLYNGYKHHHKRKLPAVLFAAGFTFLVINQIIRDKYVLLFIPVAAILIIAADLINISYCRKPSIVKEVHI